MYCIIDTVHQSVQTISILYRKRLPHGLYGSLLGLRLSAHAFPVRFNIPRLLCQIRD